MSIKKVTFVAIILLLVFSLLVPSLSCARESESKTFSSHGFSFQ